MKGTACMFRQAPPVLQTPQGVRRHTILHHSAYSRAQQLLISSAEGPNVRIQRVKEAHCGRKTQRLINSRTFLFFLIKRVATIIWQRLEKPSWRPASLTGQQKKRGGLERAVSSPSPPPPHCVSAFVGRNPCNDPVGSIKKVLGLYGRVSAVAEVCVIV